jgi:hypothetical protein
MVHCVWSRVHGSPDWRNQGASSFGVGYRHYGRQRQVEATDLTRPGIRVNIGPVPYHSCGCSRSGLWSVPPVCPWPIQIVANLDSGLCPMVPVLPVGRDGWLG